MKPSAEVSSAIMQLGLVYYHIQLSVHLCIPNHTPQNWIFMSTPPPQKNKSEHFSLLLEQLLYLDGSGSCTYAPWGRIESSSNSAEAWSECRGYKSGSGFISVIQSHITATRGQFCLCTAVNMEEDLKSVSKTYKHWKPKVWHTEGWVTAEVKV